MAARPRVDKAPVEREPRLDELPPQLTSNRAVRLLADDSFLYEQDFAFLCEAVWMHRIAEHVRQADTRKTASQESGNKASDAIIRQPAAVHFAK